MKKNRLNGFADVFKFTYVQTIKSRAMLILIIVLCIAAMASFPVVTLFTGDDEIKDSKLDKIYLYEENISINTEIIKYLNSSEIYKNVKVESVDEKFANEIIAYEFAKDNGNVLLVKTSYILEDDSNDDGVYFNVYFKAKDEESENEADNLVKYFEKNGDVINYTSCGVDAETAELLSHNVNSYTYGLNEKGEIVTAGISSAQYSVNYFLLMAALLSIVMAGSKVSEQIITEKSSKIVEYILTTVKPMALITGKVFASVAVVFTVLMSVIVSIIISGFINGALFSESGNFELPQAIINFFDAEVMKGANITTIVISIVIFIEGFIFFGFLGGIAGASVSKIEELAEGSKIFTFAMLIGAYLSLALMMSSSNGADGWGNINYIVYFLPLSAPFIVPSYMLFGIIPTYIGIAIILVNIVCILLLMKFVSNIYQQMIYHNGSPIKTKDLFRMAKHKGGNK